MATQINPRLARLWLADNIRQYGYRKPLRVESLSEPELRILDYLEAGITASQVQSLPQLARADSETVGSVVDRVSSVLSESGRLPPELTAAEIDTKFAELARLFSAEGDFADALARRRKSRIFIESLGRTGLVFAKALSASEIGTLLTLDQLRVSDKDCLPLGHPRSSIGLPRATSAKVQLETTQLQFHSRRSGSLDTVTAAVLTANDIVDPNSYQTWLARDVPHVAICFDEEGVEISPLVLPGKTPCIGCIEKARFEADSNWQTIAPQLLALDRSNEDSAMILFATGVVTNLLLHFIDRGSFVSSSALRLDRGGSLMAFQPAASPCGCGGGVR